MKTAQMFLASIVATFMCTSCTKYVIIPEESGQILFSSHITNTQSRVNGNAWDDNDEIGIFMQTEGNTEANKKYLAHPDGTLTPAPENELYYPLKGTASFLAYYPYNSTLPNKELPLSVADQSKQSAIDLLYSNNAIDITSSSNVNLQFSHKLSKLVVNIRTDESITDTKGIKVSLTGMNTTATFNLDNGILTATDSKTNIDMKVNETGTVAEAIVFPVSSLDQIMMKFTLNGKTSEWPMTIKENSGIESGCKYTFNATLSIKKGIQMGETSITDWTDKPGDDFNLDLEDSETPVPGPTPKPTPQPETTESIILCEETCGNPDGKEYNIDKYNQWSDRNNLTYSNPLEASAGRNAVVKKTNSFNGHIWFASDKSSAFRISGFSTTDYKTITLSYKIAAYKDKRDQNILKVSTDLGDVPIPSKLLNEEIYYDVTVTLPAGFTYIQFTCEASTNTSGYRLDDIKVVGKR